MANKDWIQTLGSRQMKPQAITKEMVGSIEEIAHALSMKCRFTGQCSTFYSVARHCVNGAALLPPAFAGAFLLHELSEVYLPDIASPLKPLVFVASDTAAPMAWTDLEREHTRVVLEALGLSSIEPLIYSPEVKRMDLAMLAAEKRDLFPTEAADWGLPEQPSTEARITVDSSHSQTMSDFLRAFDRYFR
jgi:hypothetical protein